MSPNAGNYSNLDTILLVVNFMCDVGISVLCAVWIKHGASSNLQPERLIILEDEKVTKANGVPHMRHL
jgi:fatty-acyl-CoA synthase